MERLEILSTQRAICNTKRTCQWFTMSGLTEGACPYRESALLLLLNQFDNPSLTRGLALMMYLRVISQSKLRGILNKSCIMVQQTSGILVWQITPLRPVQSFWFMAKTVQLFLRKLRLYSTLQICLSLMPISQSLTMVMCLIVLL